MKKLLYGVAYYDEYIPYDRLDKDICMMLDAGINVVRIAESTWSTLEPHNGVFNFKSIDRVLDAMNKAGISVIIGTPTYAVPTWLVMEHPDVLAITKNGPNKYGPRQNMDITNTHYLFYAQRVIRNLIDHVYTHPAVIGYQVDNETKHYGTSAPDVQQRFQEYLKVKFKSLDNLNHIFGLDYWSNRINSWDDFPSVDSTINNSLATEFSGFQRSLVTEFLSWQVSIINEYKLDGQFITHNFDFAWRGSSYGIQPDVDHFEAAASLDIAGVDIYHPSQENLTGCEISLFGDIARSMKRANYLVIETEAQGFPEWVPFPGQLRLQAFSHLASGANMVGYWHWHSLHNAIETYWKGLLSHDFEPNPVYNEAKTIGRDFNRLSDNLIDLKIENKVAILISNEALSSLNWFKYLNNAVDYNEVMRLMYDALYNSNIGCDFVSTDSGSLEEYKLIIVPSLYAAADELLERLNRFVEKGGHVVYGIRSGFCDENSKVRVSLQPGIIEKACGVSYSQFVQANDISLKDVPFEEDNQNMKLSGWMELLIPGTADTLARYDHPYWGQYSAITQNRYGKGTATYIGCLPEAGFMKRLMLDIAKKTGLMSVDQELSFPLICKKGINGKGKLIVYYFNYSMQSNTMKYPYEQGMELLKNEPVHKNQLLEIEPWGVLIIEEGL